MTDQQSFKDYEKGFVKMYEEKSPKFDSSVNIALIGTVNTGKSSLLNAILGCERDKPLAPVGVKSGVTTKVTAYRLDDRVLIIDCPGLDDVRKENSAETKNFLKNIDIGIFVVIGSTDSSQKANYDDLKKSVKKTIVVLNKIDGLDDHEKEALDEVVAQWKSALGTEKIFPACAKGYDPTMLKGKPMDLRGIDEIRDEILNFLQAEGKETPFIRILRNKEIKAHKIIHSYASAAAVTSAALGTVPVLGPVTGDSLILIAITAKMGQSLSRDVFNRNTEVSHWKHVAAGMAQFFAGALTIKALASLIPIYGSAVNAATSVVTVETIGWAAYHLLDEGSDLDKLSKEDIGKALDWGKNLKSSSK